MLDSSFRSTRNGGSKLVKDFLSFTGFLGGVTKGFYTDRYGVVIVKHASKGRAKVIVGRTVGYLNAPGETFVFIK